MCNKNGAVTTDVRNVFGSLIIKHHESLSDVGTIEAIQENIYMQQDGLNTIDLSKKNYV